MNYSGPERRRFERIPVSLTVFNRVRYPVEVVLKTGDKEFVSLAIDISEGGMAMRADLEIPKSAGIDEKFTILNDKVHDVSSRCRSIRADAEVRYSAVIRDGIEYRMGIHFIDLSTEDRNFIHNFVLASRAANS